MSAPITLAGVTKEYSGALAVDHLTAEIAEGRITGFLGPNGAGKSTTLRCLLGLATPTSGEALVFGQRYRELDNPLSQVGVVLDTKGFAPNLSAKRNLSQIALGVGISGNRVHEVLEMVELEGTGNKPVRAFSLGMRQRLALASALLADPALLVLDEPANGLDPLGIAWLRSFLRSLQEQGRTVLVSSHQLAEMQNTVDDVLIIHRGRSVAQGTLAEVMAGDQSLEAAFLRLTVGGNS